VTLKEKYSDDPIQGRNTDMAKRMLPAAIVLLALTAPAAAQTVFVSNEKDNSLSVIDAQTLKVTKTIKVGKRPRGITLNADGSLLYICASDDDTVQVMDTATGKILNNLPSGEDPEQFALHPDGTHLFIANEDSNVVTVVDVPARKVAYQIDVGVEPEGMAVSPDGIWAVNTSETTNMVHWIDTDKRVLVDNTLVDSRPRHAEFDKAGKKLWVSAEIGGTVSIIDTATHKVEHTIQFNIKGVPKDKIQPVGVKLSDDGRYAFVALGPANHVAVINAQTFEVEKYLLVGRRVWHLEFTPDQKRLFTSNGVSNDVSVIDIDTMTVIKSIPVGRYPWGIAIKG
jgi:PQQ-dependent catabolism-associated beta-propeller protein